MNKLCTSLLFHPFLHLHPSVQFLSHVSPLPTIFLPLLPSWYWCQTNSFFLTHLSRSIIRSALRSPISLPDSDGWWPSPVYRLYMYFSAHLLNDTYSWTATFCPRLFSPSSSNSGPFYPSFQHLAQLCFILLQLHTPPSTILCTLLPFSPLSIARPCS